MNVRITISTSLKEEEFRFIEWLAVRDGVGVIEEANMLFKLQLREEMELHEDEAKQDGFIEE